MQLGQKYVFVYETAILPQYSLVEDSRYTTILNYGINSIRLYTVLHFP